MVTKPAKKPWVVVQEFERSKDPGKFWRVDQNEVTQILRCSCPAFIFGGRTCKHVRHLEQSGFLNRRNVAQEPLTEPMLHSAIYKIVFDVASGYGVTQNAVTHAADQIMELFYRQMQGKIDAPKMPIAVSNGTLGKRRILLPGD